MQAIRSYWGSSQGSFVMKPLTLCIPMDLLRERARLLRRLPYESPTFSPVTTSSPRQFTGLKGYLKRTILGTIIAMIDCVHCVSNDARDNMLSYLPILKFFKHRVISIPNGIEVEAFLNADKRDIRREFELPPNSFLIGFLGRFMSQKGFRYLVDALERVKKEQNLPKEPLVLTFGEQDGFIREEKEDVRQRGLEGSIFFLPFVRDVAATLKGLDIVVMPSLWEACGLLAMEAMVAGVPLAGTDCVG